MKTLLVSKFDLAWPADDEVRQLSFGLTGRQLIRVGQLWKIWRLVQACDLIFISNPNLFEMGFCYLVKTLKVRPPIVVYFDVILRTPSTQTDRTLRPFKRMWLSVVDRFLCIHRDLTGYHKEFGIDPLKCTYVPFKPNNYGLPPSSQVEAPNEERYVLSLGASHRDYSLLVEAVRNLPVKLKILITDKSAKDHHAKMDRSDLPTNVERIGGQVDYKQWNSFIEHAAFVVIPILPGTIQPAGISVYLEAMNRGRAVIITKGASTNKILDERLAILVQEGDVKSMRLAISKLWLDKELTDQLGVRGKEYADALQGHNRLVHDIQSVLKEMLRDDLA